MWTPVCGCNIIYMATLHAVVLASQLFVSRRTRLKVQLIVIASPPYNSVCCIGLFINVPIITAYNSYKKCVCYVIYLITAVLLQGTNKNFCLFTYRLM